MFILASSIKGYHVKIKSVTPDPLVCPLCGQPNSCLNLDITKSCWCNDPSIKFPEGLLSQVPEEKRRKACICKACALKYQNSIKES
ncbi:cysteine-rich CWC family protein [Vibrio natriegens]|uniref:cysteine-rich CWC family protein n=1 Tax=Vibrio natriegens TaxID=691 RepID=UPI0021E7C091|nr:cysteine-rich CWC family protein [Vibrio natriegens]UYI50295.1 cysteine-rich CWC family protein [Vibrio natriegens]